ncbi:hypothetical protein JCM12296A_33890 [Desulfosarcina cetonica]
MAEELDLEFDIEEDMAAPAAADNASSASLDLDLDDELTDISLDTESASDFDFAEDATMESDATMIASIDEDLDLDLSPVPDDAADDVTMIADLDVDALELDDLSPDSADAEGGGAPDENGGGGFDDELDDLELTLDLEADENSPPAMDAGSGATDTPSDTLVLDLDLELDDEAPADRPAEENLDFPDDLTLALDLEDGELEPAESSNSIPELSDDLDLSSLESLLSDDAPQEDAATVVIGDEEDLELSFDDETTPEPTLEMDEPGGVETAADEAGPADLALDDLELSLDGDGDALESMEMDDAADQEIDLSEIEKMLEEPEAGDAKFTTLPEQDLDLDIEASLETEKWMSGGENKEPVVVDEELDLSDLEQALEDVDVNATDDLEEEPELELDFDADQPVGGADETVAMDNELEFDLSDFEEKSPGVAAGAESDDMALDFELEDRDKAEEILDDEGLSETVTVAESQAQAEKNHVVPPMPAAAPQPAGIPEPPLAAERPKPVKTGANRSLIILLIVLLVGLCGFAALYFMSQSGIQILFISDYLGPKVQDPGNLELSTYDINSKFVDNANVGKIFVISGMIKNGYADNRGMISLVGKLFAKGKTAVKQEKVYAGNVMSDLELANLAWDKIQARLANRLGDNRSNVKIEPGQSVGFMVVFSNLPDDLEEFTIEVVGSTSLK